MATPPELSVLYEDNHLLVVNKPSELPTMGAGDGAATVASIAKGYLKRKYDKPGNVYLGIVSRLDSLTSGVLVFARTSKSAARLSQQFRDRSVSKEYLALADGELAERSGVLEHRIYKDDASHRMVVTRNDRKDAQLARLRYMMLGTSADTTLVQIELETGRKHQIRVQLASLGHPVLGDQKYGADRSFPLGIALHAHKLQLVHPVQGKPMTFSAELPSYWPRWCQTILHKSAE